MRLDKLLAYCETSPSMKLLRAMNAPFIVDFLDRQFKQAARIAIPQSELLPALVAYQEELQESHPEKLPMKAELYLTEWCSALWLRRFIEADRDGAAYQLTPH